MAEGKVLYDRTALECSKLITVAYSNSFPLAIRTLDEELHLPIYAIYGFVRFADEIVDSFHNDDKRRLLLKFKRETWEALEEGISVNPVIQAFQMMFHRYGMERYLVEAFFHSMEMDLDVHHYENWAQLREYVHGSAEVVGLMCLRVFCEGDYETYERLKGSACSLGAAFQKINFLRDLRSDWLDRGRSYYPGVNPESFAETDKALIVKEIQQDLNAALEGIQQLPRRARRGVKLAYDWNKILFERLKSLPVEVIIRNRVTVPAHQKLRILPRDKLLYLALNLFIISVPLAYSFESGINYASKWYALFPAIFCTGSVFLAWDVWFAQVGVWKFNSRYVLGEKLLGLPIEEWLFFLTAPYSCIFIYESLIHFFPYDVFKSLSRTVVLATVPICVSIGLLHWQRLYTRINFLFAALLLACHYLVFGDRFLGRFLFSFLVHLIPFFLCNGILTGGGPTEEPVVFYNNDQNLRIRIHTIPVEDVVYSMSLLLMNVSIFEGIRSGL